MTPAEKFIEVLRQELKTEPLVCLPAVVQSVQDATCTVKLADTDLTLEEVRLSANPQIDQGIYVIPKLGSDVLIAPIGDDANQFYVVKTSVLESMTIKIGGHEVLMNQQGITFHGGSQEGLVLAPELKTQLSKMTARIDGILQALNGAAAVPQDGGSALIASIKASLSSLTDKEDFSSITNERIKQ